MCCYDESWLYKDMENMGFIFEYCERYCKRIYRKKIDPILFLDAFMRSPIRAEMEIGHPKLLSQAGIDTVRNFVDVDLDGDLSKFKAQRKYCFNKNQLYWVGWMYAYVHFMTKMPSKEIVEKFTIEGMLDFYYLGHEMSKETALAHMGIEINKKQKRRRRQNVL